MLHSKKGFTLIEMLVVIAIIAILVSVIIPVVGQSTNKARAATDAANLRSVLGQLNAEMNLNSSDIAASVASVTPPQSILNPGAELHILYTTPGFIEVYYVNADDLYFGLDELANMAQVGTVAGGIEKPTTPGTWYIAGVGAAG